MSRLDQLFTDLLTGGLMPRFPLGTPESPTEAYGRFVQSLHDAPASKIVCEASDDAQLRRLSAVALLLADCVVVTGYGRRNPQLFITGPGAPETLVDAPAEFAGKHLALGTVGFTEDVVAKWADDAREFIVRGRLVYIPARVVMYVKGQLADGRREWQVEHLDFDPAAGMWRMHGLGAELKATVLSDEERGATTDDTKSLLATSFALPVLSSISLRLLAEVMRDEEDAYVRFRAEIQKGIREYLATLPADSGETDVRAAGTRYRSDVVEPAVAELNQRFRKVIASRVLRVAGASVSTAALAVTALHSAGLVAGLSTISSSATGKVLVDEIAQFSGDLASLRDSAWYFGMKLGKHAS